MSESNVDQTKIPYGTLNDVSSPIGGKRERLTADTSFMDAVVNASKNQFVPDALLGTGPYKAIVLRIESDDKSSEAGSWLSNTIGSFFGDVGKIVKIKARIPEIHAALPVPQELGSADGPHQQIIDLYPTFTAQDTQIEEPKPGDIVNVDFGNKNTYADPIYLGPLIKTAGQGGSQGIAGSNIFGDCTGQNNLGLAAPAGEALPGENESKPSLSLIPLAPRIQQNLESPNETIIGEIGALINVKNDWEKALKTQAEQNASDLPGFGLLSPDESISEIFEVKGRTWIGNIPANGFDDPGKLLGKDRDTIIFAPYSTDLATSTTSQPAPNRLNRVEIIFLFHDFGGFSYEMFLEVVQALGQMRERNYILVIPEMPWSVYTNYASIEGSRIDEPFEYRLFFDEVVAKIDEVFGTTLVESGGGYIYPTVVAVGASVQSISNATLQNDDKYTLLRIGQYEVLKHVYAISPSLQKQQSEDLIYNLGPLVNPFGDWQEEESISALLEQINDVISGESELFQIHAWQQTHTFLGYDGVYPTNLDHIVTSVSNYSIGPDRTTDLIYFDGVKENIDSNAYTARALLSSKEFDANPLKNALPDKSLITDPPIADGSDTSPDGLTKEESTGFFESILPQFAEPIVQECIQPLGAIGTGPAAGLGGGAGAKIALNGEEFFNNGKNDVIVINGQEYSYPGMRSYKRFKSRQRKQPPQQLVIHNTAGGGIDVEGTWNFLHNKALEGAGGLGVHFLIDGNGNVYQHADPVLEIVSHGPPVNNDSIGIETLTPFYARNLKEKHNKAGYTAADPSPLWWATPGDGGWAVPPESMVKACNRLLSFLVAKISSLPNVVPGANLKKGGPKRLEGTIPPGLLAHRDYRGDRQDGRYFILRYLESVTGQRHLPEEWSNTTATPNLTSTDEIESFVGEEGLVSYDPNETSFAPDLMSVEDGS